MSEPKFTRGPWHVSENQPTVIGTTEKAVCKCELDWNLDADERKANAALIAAAPELYRMLEKLLMAAKTANALNPVQIHSSLICDVEETLKEARCEK